MTFARPAFTGRGRGGPHAMRGALWGRTPGLLQGRPGAPQAFPPGRPSSCGPFLRNGPDGRRRAPSAKSASVHVVACRRYFTSLALLYFTSLHLLYFTSLHFTSLHFTLLHFTSLYFSSLHFTSLHFTSLDFTSLHFTLVHYSSLHFGSLQFALLHFTEK